MKHSFIILTTIILILSLLQIILGLQRHLRSNLIDFTVYYNYSRILLSGKSPYEREFTQGIPFNYPPSAFFLFIPFSLIPKQTSQLIFISISLLFFLITADYLIRLFIKSKSIRFLLLALLLQNFPTKFTLVTGQINLVVISLLFLALYFDLKRGQLLSGLFWGLSICLKVTSLPLFFYFLTGKKWTSFVSGIITFLVLNFLIMVITPQSIRYFTIHLPSLFLASTTSADLYDQSLRTFLIRLNIPYPSQLALIIILILFLVSTWKFMKRKISNFSYFSLLLILSTIGSSFAWQHHFVFLFPGYIAEIVYLLNRGRNGVIKQVKSEYQNSNFETNSNYQKTKFKTFTLFNYSDFDFIWNLALGILNLRFFLLLISAILVGYHIKEISHSSITNPFFISHTLMGALLLLILLITDPPIPSPDRKRLG